MILIFPIIFLSLATLVQNTNKMFNDRAACVCSFSTLQSHRLSLSIRIRLNPRRRLNDVVRCLVGTFAIESHSRGRAGNIISTREPRRGTRKIKISR